MHTNSYCLRESPFFDRWLITDNIKDYKLCLAHIHDQVQPVWLLGLAFISAPTFFFVYTIINWLCCQVDFRPPKIFVCPSYQLPICTFFYSSTYLYRQFFKDFIFGTPSKGFGIIEFLPIWDISTNRFILRGIGLMTDGWWLMWRCIFHVYFFRVFQSNAEQRTQLIRTT